MSDMWQIPDGLVESLRASLAHKECMEEAHNAYLFGLQVGAEHFVETDAYKALIAELWGRLAVNRAEQRLRELDTPPNSANEHTNLGGAG